MLCSDLSRACCALDHGLSRVRACRETTGAFRFLLVGNELILSDVDVAEQREN